MPKDFNTALLVMVVGMLTVFVILSLVVLTGRILISLVNRFAPDTPIKAQVRVPSQEVSMSNAISPKVLAAIVAGVEQVSGGKGRIQKIEREP